MAVSSISPQFAASEFPLWITQVITGTRNARILTYFDIEQQASGLAGRPSSGRRMAPGLMIANYYQQSRSVIDDISIDVSRFLEFSINKLKFKLLFA
jgi:hypothetical protein